MKTILITNPKGGSGKTTLATNLAGYFAQSGHKIALHDMDRQASALDWLSRRPQQLPSITGINRTGSAKKPSYDICIVDSPAGLRGDKLTDALKAADLVIVPMQSSTFDIAATHDFLETLKAEKAVRKEKTFVAMIGMRVTARTKAAEQLEHYLAQSDFPVMGCLRNTQVYVQAASLGMSIFDLRAAKAKQDIAQWASLLNWIHSA